MIKDEYSNESEFQKTDVDDSKPRIIDVTFFGDEIGQFVWDGTKMTCAVHTSDSFQKELLKELYTKTGFFDPATDSFIETDGADNFSLFYSKIEDAALQYGFDIEILE